MTTENPNSPKADWMAAVAAGTTTKGYLDWVATKAGMAVPEEDDGPELQTFRVQFFGTFRAYVDADDIEAENLEAAIAKVKEMEFPYLSFPFDEGCEGDEIAYVEDEDGGRHEIDMRTAGEPYSWDACEFVKRIARLTAPEDEWTGPGTFDDEDFIAIEMSGDRLVEEYKAFIRLIRDARALLKAEG